MTDQNEIAQTSIASPAGGLTPIQTGIARVIKEKYDGRDSVEVHTEVHPLLGRLRRAHPSEIFEEKTKPKSLLDFLK